MNFGICDTFYATQYNYLCLSDPDTEPESDSDTQSVVSLAGHVNNRLGRLLGYRCGQLEINIVHCHLFVVCSPSMSSYSSSQLLGLAPDTASVLDSTAATIMGYEIVCGGRGDKQRYTVCKH